MRSTKSGHIRKLLQEEPAFRLLRSRSAHLVISFLYESFRLKNISSLPSAELENLFSVFLQNHADEEQSLSEDMGDTANEDKRFQAFGNSTDIQMRARRYIQSWCSEERAYLRRYYNQNGVPVVELTPGIERLFTFLDDNEPKEFVGTESRFRTILFQLRELQQNINADAETRIAALKQSRKKIDEEIKAIQATGKVAVFSPVQVRESLDEIVRSSRSLLGEFRQVEENFRAILQQIYKKQSELESTKGTILGYTLDTDSQMRRSSQGQSFSAFWHFISQDTENEIGAITADITKAADCDAETAEFLVHLKRYLYAAGHGIIEQNRILSERISRILRQQNAQERMQIRSLTAEIKSLMHRYTDSFGSERSPLAEGCMAVQTKPSVAFPQARKLVLPSRDRAFAKVEAYKEIGLNVEALGELLSQFYVDEKELLAYLAEYRKLHPRRQFTLKDLLAFHPLQKGLPELVAWYDLARKRDDLLVIFPEDGETEEIEYEKGGFVVKVKLPRLLFT